MSMDEVEVIIAEADLNGDGKLDYAEFCHMLLNTTEECIQANRQKSSQSTQRKQDKTNQPPHSRRRRRSSDRRERRREEIRMHLYSPESHSAPHTSTSTRDSVPQAKKPVGHGEESEIEQVPSVKSNLSSLVSPVSNTYEQEPKPHDDGHDKMLKVENISSSNISVKLPPLQKVPLPPLEPHPSPQLLPNVNTEMTKAELDTVKDSRTEESGVESTKSEPIQTAQAKEPLETADPAQTVEVTEPTQATGPSGPTTQASSGTDSPQEVQNKGTGAAPLETRQTDHLQEEEARADKEEAGVQSTIPPGVAEEEAEVRSDTPPVPEEVLEHSSPDGGQQEGSGESRQAPGSAVVAKKSDEVAAASTSVVTPPPKKSKNIAVCTLAVCG